MMRTNNAMRRFKQSSKSFKARGSLAPKSALVKKVEEPEEIIDVNWTLDDQKVCQCQIHSDIEVNYPDLQSTHKKFSDYECK